MNIIGVYACKVIGWETLAVENIICEAKSKLA